MKLRTLPMAAAVVAVLGVGVGTEVSAGPYGISYSHIYDLQIATLKGGVFTPLPVAGGTFTSETKAQLNNGPVGGQALTGAPALLDPFQAKAGTVTTAENYYAPQGQDGNNYARGDAAIIAAQLVNAATLTDVVAIAEANLESQGSGVGQVGRNASNVTLTLAAVDIGVIFDFQFLADVYNSVFMPNGLASPSLIRATLDTSFRVLDPNGATFFSWAPNGAVGGLGLGATEVTDPFDMQDGRSLNEASPNTSTFNPLGLGAPANRVASTANSPFGVGNPAVLPVLNSFHAFSQLTTVAGNYTVDIFHRSTVDIQRVPEPATIALLGLGLVGLGFFRRRRGLAT